MTQSNASDPVLPGWARAADGLTVVLAVAAASVAVFGGIRIGAVFSMSTPWRALVGLIIVCGLRHYLVPTPAIYHRVWSWLRPAPRSAPAPRETTKTLTRVRTVLFPALLGPCQVLLFGPLTVHATNRSEFLAPFWSLAPAWIWLLAPVVGTLVAIGLVLPTRWFARYVAVLFAIGVLLWAQGNVLLAEYGPLDGEGLDLAAHAWRAPVEFGVWMSTIALAAIFGAAITTAAPVGSQLLMALQGIVLLLPTVAPLPPTSAGDTASTAAATWRLPPPEIYQLSRTRNVIHIVLDTFSTERFVEIVDADRSTFDRDLSGFTIFADHLGAFPTTKASMPAMYSGRAYRNEVALDLFVAAQPTVSQVLKQQGFHRRSLSAYGGHPQEDPAGDPAVQYNIPSPYSTFRNYRDVTAAQLLDLSLFRHVPHGVKREIYRDQQWLLQPRVAARRAVVAERAFSDVAFLAEFAQRVTLGGDAPVYTFMHLLTPHTPVVTNADCTYPGRRHAFTVESYTGQARCALSGVRALLDRLRELDLYESSAIVLTADHGRLFPPAADDPFRETSSPAGPLDRIVPHATPFLAVKPVGSQGPMRVSYAPTALTDLPATLLDLVGLPNTLGRGVSVFALGTAPRERTYAHYEWGNRNNWNTGPFFDVLHVFSVNGLVTAPESWHYERAIVDPIQCQADPLCE